MSDTQTDPPSDEQTAGEGAHRGKHRGEAAAAEVNGGATPPAHGRHRRPAQTQEQSTAQVRPSAA